MIYLTNKFKFFVVIYFITMILSSKSYSADIKSILNKGFISNDDISDIVDEAISKTYGSAAKECKDLANASGQVYRDFALGKGLKIDRIISEAKKCSDSDIRKKRIDRLIPRGIDISTPMPAFYSATWRKDKIRGDGNKSSFNGIELFSFYKKLSKAASSWEEAQKLCAQNSRGKLITIESVGEMEFIISQNFGDVWIGGRYPDFAAFNWRPDWQKDFVWYYPVGSFRDRPFHDVKSGAVSLISEDLKAYAFKFALRTSWNIADKYSIKNGLRDVALRDIRLFLTTKNDGAFWGLFSEPHYGIESIYTGEFDVSLKNNADGKTLFPLCEWDSEDFAFSSSKLELSRSIYGVWER